jgi:hypothetical protein
MADMLMRVADDRVPDSGRVETEPSPGNKYPL